MIPRPLQPSASSVDHSYHLKKEVQDCPSSVQNTNEMPATTAHPHTEALQTSSRKSRAIHLKSVALAAEEGRKNPSAIIQALMTFSSPECKKHVLQKLACFEHASGGAAAPLTSSNILWETEDTSVVSAVITNLSKRQFDKAIGLSVLENHCVKSISVESCYLASQTEMIKKSEANSAPTERLTHKSLNQILPLSVPPRLEDILSGKTGLSSVSQTPSKLALIADNANTNSSKVLKALQFGSTKKTQLKLEPYVDNNTDSASASSKIVRHLQDHDIEFIAINAAEINEPSLVDPLDGGRISRQFKSYIPSHKLLISLEHILNLPADEMPKAVMVFESNNLLEYNPDIVIVESLVQLLKEKGVPVFIHPNTPRRSWLNRIMYTSAIDLRLTRSGITEWRE